MSLQALKQVTEMETENRERKEEAEAQARKLVTDAERAGVILLKTTREKAIEEGKTILHQAEVEANERADKIIKTARAEALRQTEQAEQNLEAAVDFIVERVVKR